MSNQHVIKALNLLRQQAKQVREHKATAAKGGPNMQDVPYMMTHTSPETVAEMTPAERAEHDALTHEIRSSYHAA